MSTNLKNQMKEVMSLAWSFVKRNGFSMSWKIQCKMPPKTKRFYPLVPK
ncbi:hypothetical protein [Bacteroides nordii]|nr:hypothetical protein [Bacteroides nordii]